MRRDHQATDLHFQDDELIQGTAMPSTGDVPPGGYVPLSKLGKYVEPGPRGKRRHVSAFYRYAKAGIAGVRLRTWRFPDGLHTTLSAWYEFIEQLTAVSIGHATPRNTGRRAARKQQSSVEAEIEAVRASIGRRTASAEKATGQSTPPTPDVKPRWDAVRGELWLGQQLCKRFRQPAANQRLLLDAFEKQGWPARIKDPLPWGPDDDPRQRLADTVRRLNQHNSFLRFELDGTSQGVLWEPRKSRVSGT